MDETTARFIEDVALFWEKQGLPRIAGRIVALLLVCDPPHRTAGQLAAELEVSKGSTSSMTRLLLTAGNIEAVAVPGDRATYYRLSPEGMERKFAHRMESMVQFREHAERALELVEGGPPERVERVRRVVSLYAFLERELPKLLERWRAELEVDHG